MFELVHFEPRALIVTDRFVDEEKFFSSID